MKAIFFFVLLLPALTLADTARIATWNLGGFHKIPQHKLENIIEGLKILDADILVLPELNPLSHGKAIADDLSLSEDSCYKAIVPDQPKARQEIAFLYKCSVQIINSGLILGSDLGKRGYRNGTFAIVRIDEFDFALIGLHLKASRGLTSRKLRTQQLRVVNGFIQGVLSTGEKDVLVIGDFNMIPVQDADNFDTLNADDSMRFISSEDLVGLGSHVSSSGGRAHIGNLLDGFGFTNIDAEEYQNGTLKIVQMHERLGKTLGEYVAEVTDHLPLVAEFETAVDND